MTAHELARQLLDGPDLPVLAVEDTDYDLFGQVDIDICHAWPARDEEKSRHLGAAWYTTLDGGKIAPPSGSFRAVVLSAE